MKTKVVLILLGLLCWSTSISAQKNNFYITGGSLLLVNSFSVSYEHILLNKKYKVNWKVLAGKVRLTDLENYSHTRNYLAMSFPILFGKSNKFFELDLMGVGINFTADDPNSAEEIITVDPFIHIGYRSYKKKWLFRTGISFPMAAYLSLGFAF